MASPPVEEQVEVVTGLSFARSRFWEWVDGDIFTTAPVTRGGTLAQVTVVKDEGEEGLSNLQRKMAGLRINK